MERWRGWIWIGFIIVVLILVSGVLNDYLQPESGSMQLESASASTTDSETYAFETDSPLQLVIRGGLGDVTIQGGGDPNTITVEYTKTAYSTSEKGAKNELGDMKVSRERGVNTLQINTAQRQDDSSLRANRVDLAITVPEVVALDIHQGGGNLRIVGVHAVGPLNARAMAGSAVIEDVIAPDGMNIQANAGSLTFTGSIGSEGDYTLIAAVGPLTVQIPAATNARVDAQSLFGRIAVEGFDLVDASDQQAGTGATLRALIGQGGPTLMLKNQMGDIQIETQQN